MGDLRNHNTLNEERDVFDDMASFQAAQRDDAPFGRTDGPPPMVRPEFFETDEALARAAKCYLDNAVLCLNEASRRGLKVGAELDCQTINHAGGTVSRQFIVYKFYVSKDLLK